MQAAIVVESLFGNTRQIADAVAAGFADRGTAAAVLGVDDADFRAVHAVDLLVVGGPTHVHGMSRTSTVAAAAHDHGLEAGGCVRTWLRDVPPGHGRGAVAFDTRFDKPTLLTGSAALGIARRLEHRGYRLVAPPTSFFVAAQEGPLCRGELERARAWGASLAGTLLPA